MKSNLIKINLGCGFRKEEGYINIDNRIEVKPDICADVLKRLPYENNSVEEVRAYDFLEHVPLGKTVDAITEIWRVLRVGGLFESFTPDAERGQGAFQDPTHFSFWVVNSWLYYSEKEYRDLYKIKANFKIESINSIRTASSVFHLLVRAIKKGR